MKKIIILLISLYMVITSSFGQISVNFEQNKLYQKGYFIVKITNVSNKNVLLKNFNDVIKNGSTIKFVSFNVDSVKLGEFDLVFSKDKYFVIKPGETKINEFSKDAVSGYRSFAPLIRTFKAIIHLNYIYPFEYPVVDVIENKCYDMERTYSF